MQFNHKAIPILDLQGGVVYTIFLNRLLLEMLKLFPCQKQSDNSGRGIEKSPRFIQGIEICTGGDLLQQDARKRVGEDSGS